MAKLNQTWDLASIFPGGSGSPKLQVQLNEVKAGIKALGERISKTTSDANSEELLVLVNQLQDVMMGLNQCGAFVGCLVAQDVKDGRAKVILAHISQMHAELASVLTQFDQLLVTISDDRWESLFQDSALKELAFPLKERRTVAKQKLPPEQEALAADLAVDGYHAWSQLYNTVVGRMTVTIDHDGKEKKLSVGQASNLLSEPDRDLRKRAFYELEKVWANEAELCADALNHLAGFRINLYKNRGWDDVLQEPLQINRMSRDTLDAMWDAIEKGKPKLAAYLERKGELLGVEKLAWYDVGAPLGDAGKKISYDEAAEFIEDKFRVFSPELADLAKHAFENRWIEAEDRPGKRPGGFCTSFPITKENRIFMTYSGTIQGMGTLAHELGHAYHGQVLKDAPYLLRRYAMNVAETASTFAELLVVDAAIKQGSTYEETLGLLEDKLQRVVAFFMNIHARFLFETRFYEARKGGPVGVEELNELMVQAQKDAFCDSLSEYHPHFWASKLHFYITDTPFYNFPYTFGYLFSAGVYAQAVKEGPGFADRYRNLLLDTARMSAEELAQKHLDVDLTKGEFWHGAVELVTDDVDEFLRLTAESKVGNGGEAQRGQA